MPKRKKLSDLYVVGREAKIADGQGNEVTVWVQRLSPVEHEAAMRKAGAVRSRRLAEYRDPDSDEHQTTLMELAEYATKEVLVDLIAIDEIAEKRLSTEAELSAEEEWADDDYLQGLYDLWLGDEDEGVEGLKDVYAADPEDTEAVRVFDELKRFEGQVSKRLDGEIERLTADYMAKSQEKLVELAIEKYLERKANEDFINEFETQQLIRAVREPHDHSIPHFASREEYTHCDPRVKDQLTGIFGMVTLEVMEGKDSPGTPGSSPSSAPLDQEDSVPLSSEAPAI